MLGVGSWKYGFNALLLILNTYILKVDKLAESVFLPPKVGGTRQSKLCETQKAIWWAWWVCVGDG